jgi:hypothetical protein
MIDKKILLNFFNFESPCPKVIKDCEGLRNLYKKQKEAITSKRCTTCTVADFTDNFITKVLYKNYFHINKLNKKQIVKEPSKKQNKEVYNDVFLRKNLYKNGLPITETTYFSKKYLYIVDEKSSYKVYSKILFNFCLNNICVYILGKALNSIKKFKILIINKKNKNVLYCSKENRLDEV